jgi:hypothetical protein
MPQQARRKRDNAAASKKTKRTTTVPVPSRDTELPQAQDTSSAPTQPEHEERKRSPLYFALLFPILLLMASNSLITFFYIRALDPLYGSVPINFYIDKVVWAATITGGFGPVPSLWPSFAVLGGLVTSISTSAYWVALYTGRIEDPAIGATLTHLVVLFPVIYFGASLVKRITVRTHDSSLLILYALTVFRLHSSPIHPVIAPHALRSFQRVLRASSDFNLSGAA